MRIGRQACNVAIVMNMAISPMNVLNHDLGDEENEVEAEEVEVDEVEISHQNVHHQDNIKKDEEVKEKEGEEFEEDEEERIEKEDDLEEIKGHHLEKKKRQRKRSLQV